MKRYHIPPSLIMHSFTLIWQGNCFAFSFLVVFSAYSYQIVSVAPPLETSLFLLVHLFLASFRFQDKVFLLFPASFFSKLFLKMFCGQKPAWPIALVSSESSSRSSLFFNWITLLTFHSCSKSYSTPVTVISVRYYGYIHPHIGEHPVVCTTAVYRFNLINFATAKRIHAN